MKNVFLVLILANALLVSWTIWQSKLKVEVKPAVEVAAPLPAAKLVLLSELPEEQRLSLAEAVNPDPMITSQVDEVVVEGGRPLCKMIGPFAKLLQAEYTVEHLSALEVAAEIKIVDVPAESDYWVYRQPLASRREAMVLLRELQVKGVDSYVFTKGELSNGISFGLFSRKASAVRRQEEVRILGYESAIHEQKKFNQETWVVVPKEQADKLSQPSWLKFMSERKNKKIEENYCPGVASSEILL